MSLIKFKIITPERTVFEEEIYQATLPVMNGEVTILPNHRSYIAALKSGEIVLRKNQDGQEIGLAVSGGFVEFHGNSLVILADAAERAEDIDIKKVEEAKARAEELRKQRISIDENEYARVLAGIEESTAWIKVARKYMRR